MSGAVTASVWTRNVARRRHDEDDLQRNICGFLDWALPDDATYLHIPNGGLRSKKQAARLKGLGVRAGAPDLLVVHRGHALFLELKAARGVVSAAQRGMHKLLVYCGSEVMLVRSVEDCERALRECGVHLRASVLERPWRVAGGAA